MHLNLWHVLGAMILAFLVGGLVCRGDRAGEAAQRTADSLAVLVDSARAQDQRRAVAAQAASQRLARLSAENARLARRGAAGQAAVDSLRALVLDTASVVLRPVYDSTVIAFQGLVQIREAERDSARTESALWQRSASAADSSARRWEGLAQAYQVQLGAALKRSRWGCVGGAMVGLGYGFIGDRPGVGTLAGLGVTCGKRL